MELKALKNIVAVTDCLIGNEEHEIFIDPHGVDHYTVTETGVNRIQEFDSFDAMADQLLIGGEPLKEAIFHMEQL